MKFNSLILFAIFSFFLLSCDSGIKFDNPYDKNSDAYQGESAEEEDEDHDKNDTDPTDSEPADTETDNPDSTPEQPDNADSTPDDDADTSDSTDDSGDSEPDESDTTDDSDTSAPDEDDDEPDEEPATRTETCSGLPANASWHNGSSITQTFDGNDWYPPATGFYSETAVANECGFKCNQGYNWNGEECKSGGSSTLPECSASSGTPCKDSTSNLIWSAKSSNTMTWQAAVDYCDRYTEDGLSDWYLPNIDELKTLLVWNKTSSCQVSETNDCLSESCWSCSTCTETGTQSSSGCSYGTNYDDGRYSKLGDNTRLWSSSTSSADRAWGVDFGRGNVGANGKSKNDYDVRCVRKELPECSASSGTPCKDSANHLTWSAKSSSKMTWQNAVDYCSSYSEDGLRGWHLPNIDELKNLLVWNKANSCKVSETNDCLSYDVNCWSCSTCVANGVQASSSIGCDSWGTTYTDGRYSIFGDKDYFWSSSPVSNETDSVWRVNFGSGDLNHYENSKSIYVRCAKKELPECSASSGTPCKDSSSGLIWSNRVDNKTWQQAIDYCNDLTEGGFSDWHLPNIDELKTLLVWSKASSCLVSETNNCLALDGCWTCSSCSENGTPASGSNECDNWGTDYGDGRFSKFGDNTYLWSSSLPPNDSTFAWAVEFHYGGVGSHALDHKWSEVRCVR